MPNGEQFIAKHIFHFNIFLIKDTKTKKSSFTISNGTNWEMFRKEKYWQLSLVIILSNFSSHARNFWEEEISSSFFQDDNAIICTSVLCGDPNPISSPTFLNPVI